MLCMDGQILNKRFLNHFCFCEHFSIPDVRIIAQIDNQTLYDEWNVGHATKAMFVRLLDSLLLRKHADGATPENSECPGVSESLW